MTEDNKFPINIECNGFISNSPLAYFRVCMCFGEYDR